MTFPYMIMIGTLRFLSFLLILTLCSWRELHEHENTVASLIFSNSFQSGYHMNLCPRGISSGPSFLLQTPFILPPRFFCFCLFKQLSYPTAVDVLNHTLSLHSSRRAENQPCIDNTSQDLWPPEFCF